jgi:hypothetical protein
VSGVPSGPANPGGLNNAAKLPRGDAAGRFSALRSSGQTDGLARAQTPLCNPALYLPVMVLLRKQLELPPEIAKAFVRDMRLFFKAKDQNKRDEIAARQRSALGELQGPRDKKLRVTDVIKMYRRMRDSA